MKQLTSSNSDDQHPDVSPDGEFIVFTPRRNGNDEIYIMDIDQLCLLRSSVVSTMPRMV